MGSLPRVQQWDEGIEHELRLVFEDYQVPEIRAAYEALLRQSPRVWPYAAALRSWLGDLEDAFRPTPIRQAKGDETLSDMQWRDLDEWRASGEQLATWEDVVQAIREKMPGPAQTWLQGRARLHAVEFGATWYVVSSGREAARRAQELFGAEAGRLLCERMGDSDLRVQFVAPQRDVYEEMRR